MASRLWCYVESFMHDGLERIAGTIRWTGEKSLFMAGTQSNPLFMSFSNMHDIWNVFCTNRKGKFRNPRRNTIDISKFMRPRIFVYIGLALYRKGYFERMDLFFALFEFNIGTTILFD